MNESDDSPTDTETMMIALDQVSQTIEVMTGVVGRLRSYVQQRELNAAEPRPNLNEEMRPDRILH
jgi:hypothetical protein